MSIDFSQLPPDLRAILKDLDRPARRSDMPRRIVLCRRALQLVSREAQPELWAALQNKLAHSLYQSLLENRAENIEQSIHHYQQALQVYTRQAFPEDWAMLQNNLGNAYMQRIHGDRSQNIEQAIDYYQKSLSVYTPQSHLNHWVAIQTNLGEAYRIRLCGSHSQNIEQALIHFSQAQEMISIQSAPQDWAALQHNIAITYWSRLNGNRAENMEQAIYHYQQALRVYNRHTAEEYWALTHGNLASAYAGRIYGTRKENIEKAIEHYHYAMEVFTSQSFPYEWAEIQNNLANAYADRIEGGRAENIEQAIRHYQQALRVYTLNDYPTNWGALQNNIGEAYRLRIRGEEAANIERAIQHYQQALRVRTRQSFPYDWATTQHNLGNAYTKRIRGVHADNLETAIQHYRQALEVFAAQDTPELWAATHLNMGETYRIRIKGQRAENIEQAIYHYQQALKVFTKQDFPFDWAMIQNNMGHAYHTHIVGDRSENIEQAIEHYSRALDVFTRQDFPEKWAMLQNHLANAYTERVRGSRTQNIETSIQHYQAALKIFTFHDFPDSWAMLQNNLANAYHQRIQGNRAQNLEKAIYHYQQALKIYTKQSNPARWAAIQHNLANNFADPYYCDTQEKSIEQAIEYYFRALSVYTRQAFPDKWAMVQLNMATAYADRTPFLADGDRAENIERAIAHYQQALEVYTPEARPQRCKETALRLVRLCEEAGEHSTAFQAWKAVVSADHLLFSFTAISAQSRQTFLRENRGLHARAARSAARAGDVARAAVWLESGRARQVWETLEQERGDLARLPELGFGDLHQRYQTALEALRNLYALGESPNRPADWFELTRTARQAYDEVVGGIRARVGQEHPEYRHFLQPLTADDLQALAADAPLLYLSAGESDGLLALVTSEGFFVETLPALSFEALGRQLLDPQQPHAYLLAYARRRADRQGWLDALERTTAWLRETVMGAAAALLQAHGVQHVYLVPMGWLSLLPLHAASWTTDDKPQTADTPSSVVHRPSSAYVLDHFTFTYVPSARALLAARQKQRPGPYTTVLAVENPDLKFAADEVRAVLAGFDEARRFPGKDAQRDDILQALDACDVLHFATHGYADFETPRHSGLLAANGETLTIRDFFEKRLTRPQLAVLSACETAFPPELTSPDEIIALPTSLMVAGIPAVVGSLWSVADVSTAILMARFYELWRGEGLDTVQALREAQRWLRTSTTRELKEYFKQDLPQFAVPRQIAEKSAEAFFTEISLRAGPDERPFEHPYHWAGFVHLGLPLAARGV